MHNPLDLFDSDEELYFYYWIEELKKAGLCNWMYKPRTFLLFDGKDHRMKFKGGTITMRKVEYTPDFSIQFDPRLRNILFSVPDTEDKKTQFAAYEVKPGIFISSIDIKGGFSTGSRTNTSAITFPLKQKWMMEAYGLYIQKIIPVHKDTGLFPDTYTPAKYLLTKKGTKQRKLKYEPKMINKYLRDYGI